MRVGSARTRLVLLRGNSASGKSSVARDRPGAANIGLARYATKPLAREAGERELRQWYRELDLLPGGVETVIGAESGLPETVDRIMRDTGLDGVPALEP
ncbi:hypothetical protein ABZ490_20780 [Streptomyces sp. NPDC005811]|uniref:hypothetical protein n=1 Tax=Streptomyces sp. NPDC005811 TaxID=3154565 RepID=UPI0033DA0977